VTEDIGTRLYDANTRIEAIWPLPNAEVPEWLMESFEAAGKLPDGMQDLVRHWEDDDVEALFEGDCTRARDSWNEIFSRMFERGISGFVVQASVPVYKKTGERSVSFSWGHTNVSSFFAPTADDAMRKAIDWAKSRYEKAMA